MISQNRPQNRCGSVSGSMRSNLGIGSLFLSRTSLVADILPGLRGSYVPATALLLRTERPTNSPRRARRPESTAPSSLPSSRPRLWAYYTSVGGASRKVRAYIFLMPQPLTTPAPHRILGRPIYERLSLLNANYTYSVFTTYRCNRTDLCVLPSCYIFS